MDAEPDLKIDARRGTYYSFALDCLSPAADSLTNMDQERPRPLFFHWLANMFFASLALAGGILFGERVPPDAVRALPIVIPTIGLLLIPLTRRWERKGIERRQSKD